MAKSRQEILNDVAAGKSVIFGGRIIRNINEVPSAIELAGDDSAARVVAIGELQAKKEKIEAELKAAQADIKSASAETKPATAPVSPPADPPKVEEAKIPDPPKVTK